MNKMFLEFLSGHSNKLEFLFVIKKVLIKDVKPSDLKQCNFWFTNELGQMKESLLFLRKLQRNFYFESLCT